MKKNIQDITLKDLFELLLSLPTGLDRAELAHKLGEITKKILWETDRDRFYEEKEKSFEAKKKGAQKRKEKDDEEEYETADDIADWDWQPISDETLRRLISGQTKSSNTAAMEEAPLVELFETFCKDYFHSDSERMLRHILSALTPLGFDVLECEEQLDHYEAYHTERFCLDLVRYARSKKKSRAAKPRTKTDQVILRMTEEKSSQIPKIDVRLLPDIKMERAWCLDAPRFSYGPDLGSPMAQIVRQEKEQRFFLLYGEADGAGKTTSLQYLAEELGSDRTDFIPLAELYPSAGLRKHPSTGGCTGLLVRLEQTGKLPNQGDLKFLLLDGLDEITGSDGIETFCADLEELVHHTDYTLILSSIYPPESLHNWNIIKNIASLLSRFQNCRIQSLTPAQRELFHSSPFASTPRLLTLCEPAGYEEQRKNPHFTRWVPDREPPKHPSTLFYRSLVVRMCNWIARNKGQDAQSEVDCFTLMYALPAVAFHKVLNQLCDPKYDPNISPVESDLVHRLLSLAFPVYKRSLHHYIAYQTEYALQNLADSMRNQSMLNLINERTGTVLVQSLDHQTLEAIYHFPSTDAENHLSALHLANLFYCAERNTLPAHAELKTFFVCPIHLLPHNLLERAFNLVDEFFPRRGWTETLLKEGPYSYHAEQTAFCRYVMCSLAAAFCDALQFEAENRWREEAEKAYEALLKADAELAALYQASHVANLCVLAKTLREQGEFRPAVEKAISAIDFSEKTSLENADGYQSLAMIQLAQIQCILNQEGSDSDEALVTPITDKELAHAEQIYADLKLQAGEGGAGSERTMFDSIPEENKLLVPALLLILEKSHLRLDVYRKRGFSNNQVLQFLLEASFVAKARSVYAALCPATSGAALNLLASFFENDQECLENNAALPFFTMYPMLHVEIDPDLLSYPDKDCCAAQVYLRTVNLRRGFQPYACRNLAQGLLSRRFRLDVNGVPIPAGMGREKFNHSENILLEQITGNACTHLRPTYAIPRIRRLCMQIENLKTWPKSVEWDVWIAKYQEEVQGLFGREWSLGFCQKILDCTWLPPSERHISMLAELYCDPKFPKPNLDPWANLCFFTLNTSLNDEVRYTIGNTFR